MPTLAITIGDSNDMNTLFIPPITLRVAIPNNVPFDDDDMRELGEAIRDTYFARKITGVDGPIYVCELQQMELTRFVPLTD